MSGNKSTGITPVSMQDHSLPIMKIDQASGSQVCLAVIKHELGNAFSALEEAESVLACLHILQKELADAEALNLGNPSDLGLRKVSKLRNAANDAAVQLVRLINIAWHRVGGSNNLSSALEKIREEVRHDFGPILKARGM
jgi:hypothetical protein